MSALNVSLDLNMNQKPSYDWDFTDYPEKNGLKVFSTFACGGGSTMGYKLAGFEVVAGNDIDPQMSKIYKENHKPKNFFLMPIKNLLSEDLGEFEGIDILDGSPPCSTFSMAGLREEAWGKKKKFREGQSEQVLDDLFFDFIDLAEKLKPKVVVAENVKGMLMGNAKAYLVEINKRFKALGYTVQLFLLNGADMGLPQRRERVFFVCNRLGKKINLNFNEPGAVFRKYSEGQFAIYKQIAKSYLKYWKVCPMGSALSKVHPKGSFFSAYKVAPNKVVPTLTSRSTFIHYEQPRELTTKEYLALSSFPKSYNFLEAKPKYVMGMSVPPLMMAGVAREIYKQIFS